MIRTIALTLNGQSRELTVDTDRRALWVLRTDLALTGTKFGCGQGLCGACTIVVDQSAVRSCEITIGELAGRDVRTIEGLGQPGTLHPLQRAFVDHQAFQCGFCTPGMLMAAYALLRDKPNPTSVEIVERLDRNLCRCGAHTRILAAVADAAENREPR